MPVIAAPWIASVSAVSGSPHAQSALILEFHLVLSRISGGQIETLGSGTRSASVRIPHRFKSNHLG